MLCDCNNDWGNIVGVGERLSNLCPFVQSRQYSYVGIYRWACDDDAMGFIDGLINERLEAIQPCGVN